MTTIFIAGHGRMRRSNETVQVVPSDVTLRWAVPKWISSTKGLSTALISGRYNTYAETKAAGELYLEHYLCPDISFIMAAKGEALRQGAWAPAKDYWLLQPREKFSTELSSIIQHLKRKFPTPLDIRWTCCRSPIGELSRAKWILEGGATREVPSEPEDLKIVKPADNVVNNLVVQKAFENRVGAVVTDNIFCINSIEGAVTLLPKNRPSITQDKSWPGARG